MYFSITAICVSIALVAFFAIAAKSSFAQSPDANDTQSSVSYLRLNPKYLTPYRFDSSDEYTLDFYRYPNSQLVESDGNQLFLESDDSPEEITSWFKQRIKERNIPINNFVSTRTNGSFFNTLAGKSELETIRIEISKPAFSNKTKISVFLSL